MGPRTDSPARGSHVPLRPRVALAVLVLLPSGCLPASPASIAMSPLAETGRLQAMRSLPLGKVSVLRPPCFRRALITRGGAITSSKASFPKIATCVVQVLRLERIFWQT